MVRMEGWDDDNDADDPLGNVQWKITYYSSSWKTSRHTFSGNHFYEIKFRFTCNSYYYGSLCTVYCKARNDGNGHYTCSSSGSKICISGWTGTNCKYGKYIVLYISIFLYCSFFISLFYCRTTT